MTIIIHRKKTGELDITIIPTTTPLSTREARNHCSELEEEFVGLIPIRVRTRAERAALRALMAICQMSEDAGNAQIVLENILAKLANWMEKHLTKSSK